MAADSPKISETVKTTRRIDVSAWFKERFADGPMGPKWFPEENKHMNKNRVPSGKRLHSYWKVEIVDFLIQNGGSFQFVM